VKDLGCEEGVYDPVAGLADLLVSGTYRVSAPSSGVAYQSVWRLKVSNGRISGKSKWTCCPGPRIDPMKGRISRNTVTIERDCTGQGQKGPCHQVYTGKLNGDVIEGTFTLNRKKIGTWTLYLNSKDDPSLTDVDFTDTDTDTDTGKDTTDTDEPPKQDEDTDLDEDTEPPPDEDDDADDLPPDEDKDTDETGDTDDVDDDVSDDDIGDSDDLDEIDKDDATDETGDPDETDEDKEDGQTEEGDTEEKDSTDTAGWQTEQKGSSSSISPKAGQWSSTGGGFKIMSGSHRFDKHWFRRTFGAKDPFYLHPENFDLPPSHSHSDVMNEVKVKQGRITVKGPGHVALFIQRKGGPVWVTLYDTSNGHRFHPQTGGDFVMYKRLYSKVAGDDWSGQWKGSASDLYGDRPMNGRVPPDRTVTYDVTIEQGFYDNINFRGREQGFGVPREIDYELWFFPKEGGGVKVEKFPVSVTHPTKPSSPKESPPKKVDKPKISDFKLKMKMKKRK